MLDFEVKTQDEVMGCKQNQIYKRQVDPGPPIVKVYPI